MLAPVPYSPDLDVFATPPTTPMTSEPSCESIIRPSLTRNSSRPSNLHLSKTAGDFKPDILIEPQSPRNVPINTSSVPATTTQSVSTASAVNGQTGTKGNPDSHVNDSCPTSRPNIPTITATDSTLKNRTLLTSPESVLPAPMSRSHAHSQSPMMSPCFVHSNLDKGAAFSDWLKNGNDFPARVDVAPSLRPMSSDSLKAPPRRYRKLDNGHIIPIPLEEDKEETVFYASEYDYDDDEGSASLTKQLADTAVGVREMSKQLGVFAISIIPL